MNQKRTMSIEEIALYGLDAVDPDATVQVNVRDLMYVFLTLEEFNRFFHQPLHYPTLDDVRAFLGSVDGHGGYKLLHTALYEKMRSMLPDELKEMAGEGIFEAPQTPFYFRGR